MITEFKQIAEMATVRFTMKGGEKFTATALNIDREQQVFWIEPEEGFFSPIPYSDIAHVSIPVVGGAS